MTDRNLAIAYAEADKAWQNQLDIEFGGGSGDARYRSVGQGEAGSTLRALYDEYRAARDAWRRAVGPAA